MKFVTKIVFIIGCCLKLTVLLENAVKDKWSNFEGIYTSEGFCNGMVYWVHANGENAIWYNEFISSDSWAFGDLSEIGSFTAAMYSSSNTLEKKCPNNEGYVWNWYFNDGSTWIATNNVYVKCANEDDFCTFENPCGTNQGDCDMHDECQDGLFCGSNNCPDFLGFDSEFDCCYIPAIGDEFFCTTANTCGVDEGDCDLHDECQESLICGSNNCPNSLGFENKIDCCYDPSQLVVGDEDFCNSKNPCGQDQGDCDSHVDCLDGLECGLNNCPNSLGFAFGIDCCSDSSGCEDISWISDNYCDDGNNNAACVWDGGDCCGINVNIDYCSACECLDPNASDYVDDSSTTSASTSTSSLSSTTTYISSGKLIYTNDCSG